MPCETIHCGALFQRFALSLSLSFFFPVALTVLLKLNLNVTYLLPANHSMTCTAIKPFDTLRFDKGWQVTNLVHIHCARWTGHTDTQGGRTHGNNALPTSFQRLSIQYHIYTLCVLLYNIAFNWVYLAIIKETLEHECNLYRYEVCFTWTWQLARTHTHIALEFLWTFLWKTFQAQGNVLLNR